MNKGASGAAEDRPGRRSRGVQAYDRLHDAIGDGSIEPGQRLMEADVAAWLRMSRTPVREALRRLQAEGLLEHAPGGGMAVVLYDQRAIGEYYASREWLEGTAAAMAAKAADETDIHVLSATCDAMAALPSDPKLHALENRVFHEQLQEAAHNRFLTSSLGALLNCGPLMGRTTYFAVGRIETALAEHAAIVDAIRARSAIRAEKAARHHVSQSYRCRMLLVSEQVRSAADLRSMRSPASGQTWPFKR